MFPSGFWSVDLGHQAFRPRGSVSVLQGLGVCNLLQFQGQETLLLSSPHKHCTYGDLMSSQLLSQAQIVMTLMSRQNVQLLLTVEDIFCCCNASEEAELF